jgi:hypothetical protein
MKSTSEGVTYNVSLSNWRVLKYRTKQKIFALNTATEARFQGSPPPTRTQTQTPNSGFGGRILGVPGSNLGPECGRLPSRQTTSGHFIGYFTALSELGPFNVPWSDEWWIGKDLKGRSGTRGTIQVFSLRIWGKPLKSWVRIANVPARDSELVPQ